MIQVPVPPADVTAALFLGILIGLPAPYWFAAERIKGTCRASLMKLPYEPPPGAEEEEALEDATEGE
jgi:hypothetical protein